MAGNSFYRLWAAWLVLAFGLVATSQALAESAGAGQGQQHALLIANSDYDHWDDLGTPQRDVDELDRILTGKYGFSTQILRNVTRGEIIDALEAMKLTLGENDKLLIYFAGHGYLRNDGGYWVGVDARVNSRSGWLKYDVINDLIDVRSGMQARHVLVVADSCYSGAALRGLFVAEEEKTGPREEWLRRMAQRRARTVMTSGGTEPVLDSMGGSSHSVFAAEFLDILRNNDGVMDASAVHARLKTEVHARAIRVLGDAAQAPEYGVLAGVGHDGGDFLFVPAGMSVGDAPAAPAPVPNTPGIRRGPTTEVYRLRDVVHIGDETIRSWAPKRGQCLEIPFSYDQLIETVTIDYDIYGAEATFVEFAGVVQDFDRQIAQAGKKRPNYWSSGHRFQLRVGRQFRDPVTLRICSKVVDQPEHPGDLDDFQMRNIRVTVN